jgi:ABC-type branched-subunit amino acid transport system ATPase component
MGQVDPPAPSPLLEVRAVTKRFGGLVANQAISFDVASGEIVGVIGPNGAGKSTLFDVVTGFHRPESGEVRLAGEVLSGLRPDQINRRGIGRTFQKLRPFSGMTVRDNVTVGALAHAASTGAARAEADRCLALVGLAGKAQAFARELPARVQREAAWLQDVGARVVMGDIPPLAFLAIPAVILLVMSLVANVCAQLIVRRIRRQMGTGH